MNNFTRENSTNESGPHPYWWRVWKRLLKIRGAVWKNCPPKESVEGDDTVLRGSVRAPEGFSEGKIEAAKPRGHSPQGFAAKGLPEENSEGSLTLPQSTVSAPEAPKALSWGDSYSTLPKDFQQLLRLPNSWGFLANEADGYRFWRSWQLTFFFCNP